MSENFAQECQFHQEKDSAAPIFVPRAQGQKGNIIAARARTQRQDESNKLFLFFIHRKP